MGKIKIMSLGIVIMLCLVMASTAASQLGEQEQNSGYYLVKFRAMPDEMNRVALKEIGFEFDEYYQDSTFLENIDTNTMAKLTSNKNIESITPYSAEMKVSSNLLGRTGAMKLIIIAHDDADLGMLAKELQAHGANEIKELPRGTNSIECVGDLNKLAYINEVLSIEESIEPVRLMDIITSGEYIGIDPVQIAGFDGSGVLAEVQDAEVELTHPDLTQVIYTDGSPTLGAHGTCTSGVVFGTGAGDMKAQGIAHQATGAYSDWGTGRYLSIGNLWNGDFNEGMAGMNGVVQSNSWGGLSAGEYNGLSNEDDRAAFDFPHVLSFWGAGNAFDSTDLGYIMQDGVAKNIICVGGVFHNDTGQQDDDQWLNKGIGSTSSRGPAADGRQKPDLCGPFDLIYTVDQVGAAGYVDGDYYFNFGCTSGATPVVAGTGVLYYEMYQENYFENNPTNNWPYSSTIKAMMIADAHQYDLSKATRNEQGWGTPDVENTYDLGASHHVIYEHPQTLNSGQSWSNSIFSDGTEPLKISLVWTDPAAPVNTGSNRALINNLDLRVTSPSGTVYWGNNGLFNSLWSTSGTGANYWSMTTGASDDLNNVENVFIQSPEIGEWTLEVLGRTGDIAIGPQDFSVVSSGASNAPDSDGFIEIQEDACRPGDSILVQVWDADLNQNAGAIETTTVTLESSGEPSGETFTLTELSVDSGIFTGNIPIDLVNSPGVLCVLPIDVVAANYFDASQGMIISDICTVDGAAPSEPAPLTVERWGDISNKEKATGVSYPLGFVFNDVRHTYTQDDIYHFIQEIPDGSNGRMNLDILYTFNLNDKAMAPYKLYLDAYTTGEAFNVRYSVNGSAFTTIGSITATSDTDSYYQWSITAGPLSTVVIQITGTTSTNEFVDTVYIDHLYIMGSPTQNTADQNTLNWTLSGDDGAGANDVAQYNIYRANNPSGPWDMGALIATLPAGTSTYTDPGKGEIDGIIWYYVVRAEDVMGNEDTNTLAVPEPGGAPLSAYDIPIEPTAGAGDWVFVSFPYVMNGNIQDVLADENGGTTWDIAKWYDASTQSWKTYSTLGSGIDNIPQINQNMGVWLRLTANDGTLTTSTSGDYSAIPVNINLEAGWNMVGYPSASAQTAQDALFGTGATWISTYQSTAPYIVDTSALNTITMSEGNAYWVYVTAPTIWTADP